MAAHSPPDSPTPPLLPQRAIDLTAAGSAALVAYLQAAPPVSMILVALPWMPAQQLPAGAVAVGLGFTAAGVGNKRARDDTGRSADGDEDEQEGAAEALMSLLSGAHSAKRARSEEEPEQAQEQEEVPVAQQPPAANDNSGGKAEAGEQPAMEESKEPQRESRGRNFTADEVRLLKEGLEEELVLLGKTPGARPDTIKIPDAVWHTISSKQLAGSAWSATQVWRKYRQLVQSGDSFETVVVAKAKVVAAPLEVEEAAPAPSSSSTAALAAAPVVMPTAAKPKPIFLVLSAVTIILETQSFPKSSNDDLFLTTLHSEMTAAEARLGKKLASVPHAVWLKLATASTTTVEAIKSRWDGLKAGYRKHMEIEKAKRAFEAEEKPALLEALAQLLSGSAASVAMGESDTKLLSALQTDMNAGTFIGTSECWRQLKKSHKLDGSVPSLYKRLGRLRCLLTIEKKKVLRKVLQWLPDGDVDRAALRGDLLDGKDSSYSSLGAELTSSAPVGVGGDDEQEGEEVASASSSSAGAAGGTGVAGGAGSAYSSLGEELD
jgi:hypothetical protein